MALKFIKYYIVIFMLLLLGVATIFYQALRSPHNDVLKKIFPNSNWQAPDTSQLNFTASDMLIRYGRTLIANTANYLGPKGSVAHISNGMNCQNCHLDAGTRLYGSNFALIAATYPKYKDRSSRIESIEFRINECLQRSLNGKKLDSLSTEMRALVAYIKWVGKDVAKGMKFPGTVMEELSYLQRAADTAAGKIVYINKCKSCHGENGEGVLIPGEDKYIYPPLWGPHSFNVSAGMYRISRLAAFVKYNMPYKVYSEGPQLSDEEAWDVAAFINTQPRPQKFFGYDWADLNTKPVDYPFGPYTDNFSATRHKYGPYQAIKKAKK